MKRNIREEKKTSFDTKNVEHCNLNVPERILEKEKNKVKIQQHVDVCGVN